MSRHDPMKVVIDGRETTVRAFAENAGLTPEAVRSRLRRRVPVVGEDGVPRYSSEAVLTDAREPAARILGMNRRDHAKRARLAELLSTPHPDGRRRTKVEIAAELNISRARLYQLLAS